ncbi:hypothetical protein V2J09_016893 [Rumex salicifolius]
MRISSVIMKSHKIMSLIKQMKYVFSNTSSIDQDKSLRDAVNPEIQKYYLIRQSKSRDQMSVLRPPIPRLLLNNVSCMRNAQQILRHVNLSIHDGGALVLTGANGSGKTTLLRMLAGFSKPSAGEVLWNGHDITQSGIFHQYKIQLGWVSLKDAIKEKFTVLQNSQWLETLQGNYGRSGPAVELMGLGRLANEKARMLSMGQRKRLQLARLLAMDRPIWLLDEPSVALDDDGLKLLEYIIAEHRKKGGIDINRINDSNVPIRMPYSMCKEMLSDSSQETVLVLLQQVLFKIV